VPLGVLQLENRLTPSLSTLASFGFPTGLHPEAALIMDGSGNFYGTTSQGGAANAGSVFELAHGSSTPTTLAFFNGSDGAGPQAALLLDGSGNLYGTTPGGGAYGAGTVFKLARGSGTITALASFNGTDGANPYCGLVRDAGGNLYGTTMFGGAAGDGTVFELARGSGTITTLASFNGTDGANPAAGLVRDRHGNLYGTTVAGGAYSNVNNGDGTVFELAQGSHTITTLGSFNASNFGIGSNGGEYPYANLIMDGSGNLYGTTELGGDVSNGTVFEVPAGGTITLLASFERSNGANPLCGLVMDASGNLYGTSTYFGPSYTGTVFELAAGSSTISALASFGSTAGLLLDGSGNLYGTTRGGPTGGGTVFEIAAGSGTLTTLALFSAPDGTNPSANLIMDGSGNLYGTTEYGGAYNDGTIFEVAAGSGTLTTLASFNGIDGANPVAGLVMDSGGNLYGATPNGGGSGGGTVFELAAGSNTITALASFSGYHSGEGPYGGLVMDGSGNLYGTAYTGGAHGYGTVFEVAAGSGAITTLFDFDGGPNGSNPRSGLVMDASGNLYGTTTTGGQWHSGTVFEVAHGYHRLSTLAPFLGNGPTSGLVMDGSGNLYGTTSRTVFKLAAGSHTITNLAPIPFNDLPQGGLIVDSFGNLYGTTAAGGAVNGGTVFELALRSGTITVLASLDGTHGGNPYAGLLLDSRGNLYGTATAGGALAGGTVFELPGAALPDQWTGANSAVDSNWSDGANWSLGVPPNPGQTVVFTSNPGVTSFTSTVDAGFTNAIGLLDIDSSWGGAISVNSPLTIEGDLLMASGSLGGSGAVTIGSIFSTSLWTGGQIDLGSGGFTTYGLLTADTTGGNLVLSGAGTLTNNGTIVEAGTSSLVLENTATLSNAAGATFDITGDVGINQSGGSTFSNAGTLEKTGGTGTSIIATTTLSNTGVVEVATGTLDVSAVVTQVSGKALTGGAWTVTGSATVHAKLEITSTGGLATLAAGATVTLNGPNTSFTNLRGLSTIAMGATLNLLGGRSFATTGALTDSGSLTLSAGSVLTVKGSFTETASGTLTVEMGGTDLTPTFGRLVSTTGTVTLAGNLDMTSTVLPFVGSRIELVDNEGTAAVSGSFAGLPEGSTINVTVGTITMVYKITYAGTDQDGRHNVIITRVS
jgi:uncharacterized repeat protein (TIGR03803 family)